MKRSGPLPASPDDYVQSLSGWQRERVEVLRGIAHRVGQADEAIKWGHLVYLSNGPAFLIRAEDERVLFGFWRGARLLEIEPRMTGSGKYEMKTLELRNGTEIDPAVAERLIREAIRLNHLVGDPTSRS
jgi:hypothetical protein